MNCVFCNRPQGKHANGCPQTSEDHTGAMHRWEQGRDDGLERQPQADKHPSYLLGWLRGDFLADTYENSEEFHALS